MPKGEFGLIGLGKIGSQIAERMNSRGYEIVGYDNNASSYETFRGRANFSAAQSVHDMEDLNEPRLVMLSVPAGAVDSVIEELTGCLSKDDTIADLGNSCWSDSLRRYEALQKKGAHYLDVGITGGLEIECEGAGVMVGGDKKVFERYRSVFEDIAARDGLVYVGKSGTGHFVKAVHNAVEYVIEQAVAEAIDVLLDRQHGAGVLSETREYYGSFADISDILRVWEKGINPRLIHYASEIMKDIESGNVNLDEVTGKVGGGDTGKWVQEHSEIADVLMPGLAVALKMRETSSEGDLQGKIINLLRNRFGGHPCEKKDKS